MLSNRHLIRNEIACTFISGKKTVQHTDHHRCESHTLTMSNQLCDKLKNKNRKGKRLVRLAVKDSITVSGVKGRTGIFYPTDATIERLAGGGAIG